MVSTHRHLPSPLIRVNLLTSSKKIPTVQSSGGNRLLFDHRPVGPHPPRAPRRQLEYLRLHPVLPNTDFRSSRHRVPKNRGSAGSVRGRARGLPHGDLGVWKAGVRQLFRRLSTKGLSVPPPLHSDVRAYVHTCYWDTVEPRVRFYQVLWVLPLVPSLVPMPGGIVSSHVIVPGSGITSAMGRRRSLSSGENSLTRCVGQRIMLR